MAQTPRSMDVQSLSIASMFQEGAEYLAPTKVEQETKATFVLPAVKQMQNKTFDPTFDAPNFDKKQKPEPATTELQAVQKHILFVDGDVDRTAEVYASSSVS